MKTSATLVAAFCLIAALSGCFGEDPPASTTSPSTTTSGSSAANTTTQGAGGAPIAIPAVLDNGTALHATNGTLMGPMGVNLTFDGSESSDPNGDEITFEWDFGDGVTSAEPSTLHSYAKEGNYTIILTVTDATGLTGSANATLNISAADAAPAYYFLDDADVPTKWTFTKQLVAEGQNSNQNHPTAAGWHTSTKDK